VQTGTRDATQWLLLLAPHAVTRATLHVLVASLSVEWTPAGLVVTLETSEGGEAFDLLTKLPAQDIARLVLREHPGKRARQRLESLGRLKRLIATLAPREVVMPVRWKNWLTALDRIR